MGTPAAAVLRRVFVQPPSRFGCPVLNGADLAGTILLDRSSCGIDQTPTGGARLRSPDPRITEGSKPASHRGTACSDQRGSTAAA